MSALNTDAPGLLLAGRSFLNAGGVAAADRLARWNGSTWSAVGPGLDDGTVTAIALADGRVFAGGSFTLRAQLYAGGSFTGAGGIPRRNSWPGTGPPPWPCRRPR